MALRRPDGKSHRAAVELHRIYADARLMNGLGYFPRTIAKSQA